MCFDAQLKMLRQAIFEEFELQMRKVSKRDVVNDVFHKQTQALLHDKMKNFTSKSGDLVIDGSGWANQVH